MEFTLLPSQRCLWPHAIGAVVFFMFLGQLVEKEALHVVPAITAIATHPAVSTSLLALFADIIILGTFYQVKTL